MFHDNEEESGLRYYVPPLAEGKGRKCRIVELTAENAGERSTRVDPCAAEYDVQIREIVISEVSPLHLVVQLRCSVA